MNTKKILVTALALWVAVAAVSAQDYSPYSFKAEKLLEATPVKNQQQTGTCWAFSCASFLESEVRRINNMDVDLSEMFVVRHVYRQKCENYVRRQGTAQFSEGGLAHDLIRAVRRYGIVPEDIYPGRKDPSKPFNHSNLERNLRDKCKELVELGKKGELPTGWISAIDQILDEEFGKLPGKFSIEGRPYTAQLYRDYLGIRPDDYVTITSFTHHPFYEPFVLEVPDNFSNGLMHNLPLDDMMRCLTYALQQGHSVEWDADVSNEGFSAKNGLAIVPSKKWADKNEAQREGSFRFVEPQVKATQAYRQELFDQQVTMDDHLMHITGLETETNSGEKYYRVKNSWGEISDLKGYLRVSDTYMRLNTISFMVNKNALPKDIAQRLNLLDEPAAPTTPQDGKTPVKIKTVRPAVATPNLKKASE
jgi:bleomycin hydrolase